MPRLSLFVLLAIFAAQVGCESKPATDNNPSASNGNGASADKNDTATKSGTETENKKTSDSKTDTKSKGTIGVSLLTLENPFFIVIGDNITKQAKEHGFDTIVVSADKDPAKQSDQVKDFIVKGVKAIVLSPAESRSIVPAIQEANRADIPVFTVDIPCDEPGVKIASQIATDNFSGGKMAGDAIVETVGETGGKVAILDFPQAESCRLRVKGFNEVIDAHNKEHADRKIEIVAKLDGGGSKDVGARAMADIINSHADLKGVFAINDPSALGAVASLEKAGMADRVTVVGFDGMPEGKQAIKDGKIYADPIQYPDKMGIKVADAIHDYYQGEDLEKEIWISTKLYKKKDAMEDASLK